MHLFLAQTFVLPARHPVTGIRMDFIFSTSPYEQEALRGAVPVTIDGTAVPFASAEDLLADSTLEDGYRLASVALYRLPLGVQFRPRGARPAP